MALTAELVAHCERPEPDPGPEPNRRYFTDVEYEAAAARLIEQTAPDPLEAGLSTPHLFCECVIGDSASLIARWLALTYRAMLPHIARLGLEPPAQVILKR
jgi:hypothetical protein